MMKKIIILAYIMAVLALSGMVKASVVGSEDAIRKGRGLVRFAEVSPAGILDVRGVLVTSCDKNPKLVVNDIDAVNRTLSLMIQTEVSHYGCLDVISKPFRKIFDMKSLPLREGSAYSVIIDNFAGQKTKTLNYKVSTGNFNADDYKTAQQDFKGQLVINTDANQSPIGFSLQNGNEAVSIVSPDMLPELTTLVPGETVHISGFAVNIGSLNQADALALSSQGQSMAQVIVPVSISQ